MDRQQTATLKLSQSVVENMSLNNTCNGLPMVYNALGEMECTTFNFPVQYRGQVLTSNKEHALDRSCSNMTMGVEGVHASFYSFAPSMVSTNRDSGIIGSTNCKCGASCAGGSSCTNCANNFNCQVNKADLPKY